MINIILSYLIKIIHLSYVIISLIGPYIFKSIPILLLFVGLYILTIAQWYIFNKCLLTDIEDKLLNNKTALYKDGTKKSFMILFLERNLNINEKVLYYIFVLIPVINCIVCLVKIYLIYMKECNIKE